MQTYNDRFGSAIPTNPKADPNPITLTQTLAAAHISIITN